MDYKHVEAFSLMWYLCSTCTHKELIWNSRDGVTPFCLGCPSCGQLTLRHHDWRKDIRDVNYKLNKGQRFFRDGTIEEGIDWTHKQIEIFKANGEILDEETIQVLLKDAREGKGDWEPGWPKLDIFQEE